MLTIQPLSKAEDALKYYTSKDNYYLKDKDTLKDSSYWIGKGAKKLNLAGTVEPQMFLQLLNGELPNGKTLGIIKNGKREHSTGIDVTLSAPKSVSLLALAGKDNRLVEAHQKAVAITFERIEAMAAEARITFNKKTAFEKTNNLTAATFLHSSSRALDPNMHTHMVILNMTERLDKMWRALSSRSRKDIENLHHGFSDIIYQNQHYLGLVYMSTLAKEVKALGFDIRIKDIYGNFEIEGVSDEVIQHLSKRRDEIKKDMEERGTYSAKAAEVSNVETREQKADIDSNELLQMWLDDIDEFDIDLDKIISDSATRLQKGDLGTTKPNVESIISPTAIDAVNDALSHLSEFNTQIKHSTLVRQAFSFAAGTISHEEIEQQIEAKLNDKSLKGKPLEYYTTNALVEKEQQFAKEMTKNERSSFTLKSPSSSFATSLLKNNHKVQIIDVNGMSNQKNLIQNFIDITESNNINTYVLHQSKYQSQLISDEVSRKSTGLFSWLKNLFKEDIVHTVAGFKYQFSNDSSFKKKQSLIVVHDAQKLSIDDLSQLKSMSDQSKGKLILLNNTKSTIGFNPGNPINTLKDNGIQSTTFLSARHKVSVDLAITNQPINTMIEAFCTASIEKDEKVTLLALTNAQSNEITENVRNILKEQGVISHQAKTARVLSTQGLTDAQKKHTKFYKVGDRVTFKAFTKEQRHYEVSGIDKEGLLLTNQDGKQSHFKLSNVSDIVVSRAKNLEFAIGDEITNDRAIFINRTKFDKGTCFKVKSISQDKVILVSNKETISLDNKVLAASYLSHNYCKKMHQLTKEDHNLVVAALPYQLNSNIVGEITEVAKKVSLFTNNKIKAENFLNKEQLKWSAVDISTKKPDLIYRDIAHSSPVIEKDLNRLIDAMNINKKLDKTEVAKLAVSYAVAKCAEKNAAFKHSDLMVHALKYALGKADFEDIAPVLKERIKDGSLIHLGTYWTTKEALALEESIIRANFKEQGTVKPITPNSNQLLTLPNHLTQGQKDAISLATTSGDRFISVQGLAGVGKTTMMREIQAIANRNGYKVLGLAPTHQAKDELSDAEIESNTVDSFLTHHTPIDDKTVLIVDEASMLDNQTYHALQNRAIEANAYVIFAGDITQLQSLSSGIPHELTIKSGSQKTAMMLEIIRQNPNPELKKAAEFASNRQISKAFEQLEQINPVKYVERTIDTEVNKSSFIEVVCEGDTKEKNYETIYEAVAQDYLSRTKSCQNNTIVVVHAHKDRAVIDQKIRSGLQEQGSISKNEVIVERLMHKSIDLADKINVSNLEEGDVLRFGKTYHIGKRGEYFTVQSISPDLNTVTCLSDDNLLINIKANTLHKGKVSAYTKQESPIAEGDKLRLKLSDENRGFVANKEYTISSVEGGIARLENEEERTTLNLQHKGEQHWDYGYTNTAYSTQGATTKLEIGLELEDRVVVTTHRSHEIDITRASHQATIYTDNKEGLVSRLENPLKQLEADKTSAIIQKQKFIDEKRKVKDISSNLIKHNQHAIQKATDPVYIAENANKTTENHDKLKQNIDANELLKSLNSQAEHLVKHLLGEPNPHFSKKNEYRYGNKGSFAVNLSSGLWHSFETGEGGNLFTLIQQEKGLSNFKDVLDFSIDFTRYQPSYIPKPKASNSEKKEIKNEGLRDTAIKLYNKSKPIKGSLVEKYLNVHRSLYQVSNADIKYCPLVYSKVNGKSVFTPALLAFSRNSKGEINHVQVTKLDTKTANKSNLFKVCKQTFGRINGHAVNLNHKGEGDTTYLTEGVETGLSILEVNPKAKVLTVLGKENFASIDTNQLTKNVVICLDNDGINTFKYQKKGTNKVLMAIDMLQANSIKTNLIIPKNKGEDLNDILQNSGKKALSDILKMTISPQKYKEICDRKNENIPTTKMDSNQYNLNSIKEKATLIDKFQDGNLMNSSLIGRLKDESMRQSIKDISIKSHTFQPKKTPTIPNKEMDREL